MQGLPYKQRFASCVLPQTTNGAAPQPKEFNEAKRLRECRDNSIEAYASPFIMSPSAYRWTRPLDPILLMKTESLKALAQLDPKMGELIERVGPIHHEPRRLPTFRALAQAIVHQQLSGKAAGTILSRFQALYPSRIFPVPEDLIATPMEVLRSVGLSRPKSSYMIDLASRAVAGKIPSTDQCDTMTDGELVRLLTEIKGIGAWTVEMMLIFNLGRPDVLPIHDLGVQNGYQKAYGKRRRPTPEQLARAGRKWSPHRTLATLYLWRAVEL